MQGIDIDEAEMKIHLDEIHTCQPIQFTGIKYIFFIIWGGYV